MKILVVTNFWELDLDNASQLAKIFDQTKPFQLTNSWEFDLDNASQLVNH